MPAADFTGLRRLHDVIQDNAYAGTFQTFGQYRDALLKHIVNLATPGTTAPEQALIKVAPAVVPPPAAAPYTREDAETFAQALIALGWHNDHINCVEGVHALLQSFLSTHTGGQE